MQCITCGDRLHPDRVEHGYHYCVKPECVEQNFTGIRVVEVAVNKSASQIVAADDVDEALKKTKNGEYGRKNTTLGSTMGPRPASSEPRRPRGVTRRATPTRAKRWTPEQEKIVTVFNEMGLRPDEMIERAPHLHLTIDLITEIVCSVRR